MVRDRLAALARRPELIPGLLAIATFVMILSAGYLLFMYGRIVFGEVSDFLKGLGDHLTDMTPIEILTLVPLGVLVVVFGIQPGLLLDLVQGTVVATLADVAPATSIAIPAEVVAVLLGLIAVGIVARIAFVLLSPRPAPVEADGGAAH